MSVSTVTAAQAANACIVLALLTFGVWAIRFCYRRARAADALCDRILRETPPPGERVWDDNAQRWITLQPGQEPADCQYTADEIAVLDRLVLAFEAPAFDPATDPQWAAARQRLLTDLRNNDPQGEL